jgi:IS5 family transposase
MRRAGDVASFAEALVVGGGNRRLEAIAALIDWPAVERLLEPVYAAPTGRASYPVLSLFKAVLLGAWYGLGDPELEAALGDRLSFRRFAGLALDATVPDHSTLWRFRDELRRLGLSEAVFAEVNRQLEVRGLVVKAGTLVDATLVRHPSVWRRRPSRPNRRVAGARPPIPMRPGPSGPSGPRAARILATSCMSGSTPARGSCGGRG